MEDKNRQTLMYLEAIQKLSMFILRREKTSQGTVLGSDSSTKLDKDTVMKIKSLMDENVFELLDKTECKVLQL